MADFIDFINDETFLASDPLFSQEALKVYVEKEGKESFEEEEVICFKRIKCPVCEEKHNPLGWCVAGPLTKSTKKCNRVLVKDAVSGNIAFHYFGIQGEIKDLSAKQMLKLIYNTEFSVTRLENVGVGSPNFEELPYQYKKFLEMTDEITKKVGKHYQLPLPLKNH